MDKPKFEQALQTLTDTLRDATPQLRGALDGVANLSRSLNKRDEALEQLLAHAKKVTDTLAQRAGQVNQLVTDGNLLFAALDERRQALSNLIAGIDDVSHQLSGFVADNRREFKPALEKLNAVMDNLLERTEHIGEALRRLPPYATALGEVVGSGPGFQINLYGLPPAQPLRGAAGHLLPAGQAARQPRRLLRGLHLRAPDHQAEVAMTHANPSSTRGRWLRVALAAVLVAMLVVGVYLVWPSRAGHKVVGYFTSAVGLYPGDDVRIVGVPVGTVDSIEPRATDVKVTMSVKDGVKVPADAKALIIAPNLVSARFVQLTPAYTGGAAMADGASIGLGPHGRSGRMGRGQGTTDAAQHAARTAAGVDAGPAVGSSSTRPPTPSTATATRSGRRCANCRRPLGGWVIRAPTCSAPSAICRCSSTRCRTATNRSCSSPTTSPRSRRCWPTARRTSTTPWAR